MVEFPTRPRFNKTCIIGGFAVITVLIIIGTIYWLSSKGSTMTITPNPLTTKNGKEQYNCEGKSGLGTRFCSSYEQIMWDHDWLFSERILNQQFGLAPYVETGTSEVKNEKDKFTLNIDVKNFSPEEIQMEIEDNYLIITGKCQEKIDQHGFESHSFTRRYVLPKEVNMEHIVSNLNHDGFLTIEAQKQMIEASKRRTIPIKNMYRAPKSANQR